MVEGEALNKMCPFTMQPIATRNSYNINNGGEAYVPGQYAVQMPYNCVGSRCMAWEELVQLKDEPPMGYCKLVEERNL